MSLPEPATAPLVIHLLGPMEVRVHGAPLPHLRTRKGAWLLALLSLRAVRSHNRSAGSAAPGGDSNGQLEMQTSAERACLAGTLWPESLPPQAMESLRKCLKDLRRALGPEAWRLTTPARRYLALDLSGAEVDLLAFDAAVARRDSSSIAAAVDLYKGPLLEGCPEEWAFQERRVREESYLAALERLAGEAQAGGDATAAECYWRRAVAVDPLRESAQRALMQVLGESGSYASALEVYRELRLLLHRELNAPPDLETTGLFERIRARAQRRAGPPGEQPFAASASTWNRGAGWPCRTAPPQSSANCPDAPPHNLPAQPTPLLGREQAVEVLRGLLQPVADARLLTLTGPGGTGKTRLALQVAAELLAEFADGVFFVDLAPITDPGLVAPTIARVVGVEARGDTSLADGIMAYAREKQLLLLLDNFEQVLPAAPLVAEMLATAPRLKVLVTSRAALHLRWEKLFPVPPLALPDRKRLPSVEALSRYAAIELFIQRVWDVQPEFAVSDETAPAVAEICHRLDGLPLAIELAAARIRYFSLQALLDRLENRLRLLTGGPQDLPARQQTLRDEIAWSYDLLGEAAKSLFRRLSVFVGGCTLEALLSVCGAADNTELPDGLEELLRQSLVRRDEAGEARFGRAADSGGDRAPGDGEARFRMLGTIREYARECLARSGEEVVIRSEHARYFLELAERAEREFWGPAQLGWLDRLETEHDNIRAALCWLEDSGKGETALRLAAALTEFWHIRDHTLEAVEHLTRLLALTGPADRSAVRAKALNSAGMFAVLQRDWNTGRPQYEEALSIWREREDRRGIAASLWGFGVIAIAHEEWEAAAAFHGESLALRREAGDEPGIASSLQNLGALASARGDAEHARAQFAESLAIWRKRGCEGGMNWPLHGLGGVALGSGDLTTARTCFEECLAIRRRMGFKRSAFHALEALGVISLSQGRYEEARSRFEEALALNREGGRRGDIGSSLLKLGHVELQLGRLDEASSLFRQGLALGREAGDSLSVGSALLNLGLVALAAEELSQAGAYFEEGRAVFQEMGDLAGVAEALHYLAQLTLRQGDVAQARERFAQYLLRTRAQGDRLELTQCLQDMAALAVAHSHAADAARLFGAAEAQRDSMGAPIPPVAQPVYERDVTAARRALGEEAFATAWAEGRAMPLEHAIEIAQAVTART